MGVGGLSAESMGSQDVTPLVGAKTLPIQLPPIQRVLPPFPTGVHELDQLLPGGGLAWGSVVELMAPRGLGFSTSLALTICAKLQRAEKKDGWCVFLDPTSTLHEDGVSACGVDPERLLVVRPPMDAMGRMAVRITRSQLFSAIVIDTAGVPGSTYVDSLGPWVALARRLASASEGRPCLVMLLTHREMGRPLPLPVAERVELTQERPGRLLLRLHRHQYGLPSDWQSCSLPLLPQVLPSRVAIEAS